jgi:ribonuclease HI
MLQLDDNALNVFTDGSSLPSPRRGGIGVLFVTVDEAGEEEVHPQLLPGYKDATNNQMEIKACIEALRIALGKHAPFDLSRYRKIAIYTDSLYVDRNFNLAVYKWPATGWKGKGGRPILNVELWKELVRLAKQAAKQSKRVELNWVKGKSSPYTNVVHKLAKQSAEIAYNPPISVVKTRRKKTSKSVEVGSVKMDGQLATIHVIGEEYLSAHGLVKYRYEVMNEDSPYYGNVDFVYSEISLRARHQYLVRFNDDTQNPRIERLCWEVGSSKDPDHNQAEGEERVE